MSIFWTAIKVNCSTNKPVLPKMRVILTASALKPWLEELPNRPILLGHFGKVIGKINRVKLRGDWLIISGRVDKSKLKDTTYGGSWEIQASSYIKDRVKRVITVNEIQKFYAIAFVTSPASHYTKVKLYEA